MKKKILIPLILCASWLPLSAQNSSQVEQLRQQLEQVKEAFEKAQAESRRQIDELTRKLDEVLKKQSVTNAVAVTNTSAKTPDQLALEKQLAAELGGIGPTNASAKTIVPPATQPWTPSQPLPVVRAGQAYLNTSFDALFDFGWSSASDPSAELQLGGHDPTSRGFTIPNAEIALDGAVDPYFKGFANIILKLDNDGETEIELEEVFGQTTSLPWNLQLKAGQFFAAFGRQNPQHPHQWAFADQPLILNRTMGPDGLRNAGAQLSWLVPLPFFTEASVGVFNGQGETTTSFRNPGEDDGTGVNRYLGRATHDRDLRGIGDFLYVPRLASSFDLTDEQTLVAGVSGAFAPNNTGAHTSTEIYGLDLYWKWKPVNAHAGFPFVSWQTELLYRNFDAAADASVPLRAETIRDYGFYSQVLWGFRPRWVAGLRGEWVTGNDSAIDRMEVMRGDRTRISPVLTFFPSEFSKVRLQYNYDHGQHFGDEHSVWLQLEFLLGAHGAHQF
jgi:hypothetical protein